MMEQQLVSLSLSPEIETVLIENELDLFYELKDRVPEITRPDLDTPLTAPTGFKSIELTILASAAAAPLIANAIVQILDAIQRQKRTTVSEARNDRAQEVARALKFSFLGLKVEFSEKHKG